MSRFLIAGMMLVVAGGHVLGQSTPSEIHYDLATGRTYLLSPSGADWQAARAYSRTLGGYLATINDSGEQAFINAHFANHSSFWIGLSDAQTEGVFTWDSGQPLVYTNWCAGEPNGATTLEDYVQAVHTPAGFCWSDVGSPYVGPGPAPTQGLIELQWGTRANFDSYIGTCLPLPTPLGAPGDPDHASWNGAGAASTHRAMIGALPTGVPNITWPVNGAGYLIVEVNGPLQVPVGGPFQRPAAALANEVRIPIPAGAKGVSYAWEFLTAEDSSGIFNDGISIAVVDANGVLIQELTYADAATPKEINVPAVPYCSTPPTPVTPVGSPGPQSAAYAFLPLPYPSYLSIVCWNGSDNSLTSSAAVDAIQFWGEGKFTLTISAPAGPGSISIVNFGGGSFDTYTTAVSLTQGNFPQGWLFGVDIGLDTLFSEMSAGAPFHGTLSAGGASFFNLSSGVPSGIPIYAVSLQFTQPGPFGGSFVSATAPEFFLTP